MYNNRIVQLDIIRGVAVLLVMGYHFPLIPGISTAGYWGVDLFFVLSGFLISGLLFRHHKKMGVIGVSRFYLRRAFKIYPSAYVMLALTYVVKLLWAKPLPSYVVIGDLLLTQNYLGGGIWIHTWSLAVEEHFYLFLPPLLFAMTSLSRNRKYPFDSIPYVFASIALLCLALRIDNALRHPVFEHLRHFRPSHLRFDSLFFGVFLSYLHNYRPQVLQRWMSGPFRLPIFITGTLCLASVLCSPSEDLFTYTLGFTLAYIGFGVLLLFALYPDQARKHTEPGRISRFFGWVGTYSYTLYLWHVPVLGILWYAWKDLNPFSLPLLYYGGSFAAAICMSKLVELPALRLREQLTGAS